MSSSITRPAIVVGVDGSPASKVAVDWAARDAAMRNVPLALVHVVTGLGGTWAGVPLPGGVGDCQQRRGRDMLDDAVRVARDATRDTVIASITTEMYFSASVPTLVDMSKGAEMIVVGRRGHGGGVGNLLGSVSAGVVQHAHCPVAVIRDEDPMMPHPAQAPVLAGIDGSQISELATSLAFEEASLRQVDLVALHAWSDTHASDLPDLDWTSLQVSADDVLAERLAGWQERYPDVNVHRRVVCDRPAHQLIEQSASAQLTVVGSHGRGGFAGMLLGSVSAALSQTARMPVIVARQP